MQQKGNQFLIGFALGAVLTLAALYCLGKQQQPKDPQPVFYKSTNFAR